MKLATILWNGVAEVVLVDAAAGSLRRLDGLGEPAPASLIDVVRDWRAWGPRLRAGVDSGSTMRLDEVRLLAPIPRPARNIFCVGKNYFEHAHEFHNSDVFDAATRAARDAVPKHPIVFSKVPESVIGPGDEIRYPAGVSDKVDYEAELAVIIGTGGRAIPKADAMRHVWGYTIVNDVTARDLQKQHDQWHLGKSLDTFCPMGPWAVTADELDATALELRCWVNGELRQQANTRDMIFDIPTLIATISAGLTLLPGDIIATGTPAGVGIGFAPPRYLRPGDEVAIEVAGIGRLVNRIGSGA